MKISKTSIALLVVQLALVSSVAAKYLYQRWTCPKVWARAEVFDPTLPMRGRYLSLQLVVDGCRSTLPSVKQALVPRNFDGSAKRGPYFIAAPQPFQFSAQLKVEGNKLAAIRIEDPVYNPAGILVDAWPGVSCDTFLIHQPIDFYVAEHTALPTPLQPNQELWIEVTVPRNGPPRPIQLALKQDGAWKPLAFQ
jgi:hypothetical protein